MDHRLLRIVAADRQLTYQYRLLFCVIWAECKNSPTHSVEVSFVELSNMVGGATRSCKDAIKYMVDTGYLIRDEKLGPNGKSVYRIGPSDYPFGGWCKKSTSAKSTDSLSTESAKSCVINIGSRARVRSGVLEEEKNIGIYMHKGVEISPENEGKKSETDPDPQEESRAAPPVDEEEWAEPTDSLGVPDYSHLPPGIPNVMRDSLGRLPSIRMKNAPRAGAITRAPSGPEFTERPSERWELTGWRNRPSHDKWSAADLLGYWAHRYLQVYGKEDPCLFCSEITKSSPISKCIGIFKRFSLDVMGGDQSQTVDAIEAVLTKSRELGWGHLTTPIYFWFRPSRPDVIRDLLDGKPCTWSQSKQKAERPSAADDRSGQRYDMDADSGFWDRGGGN